MRFSFPRQRVLLRAERVIRRPGCRQRPFPVIGSGIEWNSHIAPAPAPPPPTSARLIDGYAVNPGLQTGFTAKPIDALKSAKEGFLSQIPRLFGIAGQADEQRVNITGVLSHHPLVSSRFPAT